jgi:hypothetical protein
MDALPISKKVYTPEEYLEMECESVERHEYRDSKFISWLVRIWKEFTTALN